MGVEFARKYGYHAESNKYAAVAAHIGSTLPDFWHEQRNLILYNYGPVLRGKSSYKDISVVLSVLHGYAGDGVYAPTNDQVLATAYQVATSFLEVYKIANVTKDKSGKPIGMPVG